MKTRYEAARAWVLVSLARWSLTVGILAGMAWLRISDGWFGPGAVGYGLRMLIVAFVVGVIHLVGVRQSDKHPEYLTKPR